MHSQDDANATLYRLVSAVNLIADVITSIYTRAEHARPLSIPYRLLSIVFCRREQWPLFSSYACWQQLVNETKSLSRDHAALSEVYSTHLVGRLNQVMEDVQRIYKRVSVIRYAVHDATVNS